ncbi:hypothetical protein Tco_0483684 [Tanacetum coccineum]
MHPYSLNVFLSKKAQTWLFLFRLLTKAIQFGVQASKERLRKLAYAKTLRIVVRRAEDDNPEIVKRWNNKVQEDVQSRSALVQFPAFAMLQQGYGHAGYAELDDVVGDDVPKHADFFRPTAAGFICRAHPIGKNVQGQFRLGAAVGSQSRTADIPAPVTSQAGQRKDDYSGSSNTQPGVSVACSCSGQCKFNSDAISGNDRNKYRKIAFDIGKGEDTFGMKDEDWKLYKKMIKDNDDKDEGPNEDETELAQVARLVTLYTSSGLVVQPCQKFTAQQMKTTNDRRKISIPRAGENRVRSNKGENKWRFREYGRATSVGINT